MTDKENDPTQPWHGNYFALSRPKIFTGVSKSRSGKMASFLFQKPKRLLSDVFKFAIHSLKLCCIWPDTAFPCQVDI